jgi:hypothetical protein
MVLLKPITTDSPPIMGLMHIQYLPVLRLYWAIKSLRL